MALRYSSPISSDLQAAHKRAGLSNGCVLVKNERGKGLISFFTGCNKVSDRVWMGTQANRESTYAGEMPDEALP